MEPHGISGPSDVQYVGISYDLDIRGLPHLCHPDIDIQNLYRNQSEYSLHRTDNIFGGRRFLPIAIFKIFILALLLYRLLSYSSL